MHVGRNGWISWTKLKWLDISDSVGWTQYKSLWSKTSIHLCYNPPEGLYTEFDFVEKWWCNNRITVTQ